MLRFLTPWASIDRQTLLLPLAAAALALWGMSGCGEDTSSGGAQRCADATTNSEPCSCADGTTGSRACAAGVASPCDCSSSGDVGTDLGGVDIGFSDDVDGDDVADIGDDVPVCTPSLWYPDGDGDGFADARSTPIESCEGIPGHTRQLGDCDDTDAFTYSGAPELCDGIDNDCDQRVDENLAPITQWVDEDGDFFGDPNSTPVTDCNRLVGYAPNNRDCDDQFANVYPGAPDLCDGVDNDCDRAIDEDAAFALYWVDEDEDGFGDRDVTPRSACEAPEGWVDNDGDCLDDDPDSNVDGEEICDLRDNDCDGVIDEGTGLLSLYPDLDGDGFGDDSARATFSCTPIPAMVGNRLDCNDVDELIYPGQTEVCDGLDNNCDGLVDVGATGGTAFYADRDADGWGDPATMVLSCVAPAGMVDQAGDCDDRNTAVNPGATEVCDNLDNNCDGRTDEELRNACGVCGAARAEVCGDGLDNDCDGVVDNGCGCDGRTNQACYSGPPQTRGIGVCRGGTNDCNCPGGARFCTNGTYGPCAGQVLPSAEVCDELDNDCDGAVDEGLRNACGSCGPAPTEVCDNLDNDCDGLVDEGTRLTCGLCAGEEGEEVCGDGFDNDCDGLVDEGCACLSNDEPCYPGPPDTVDVGQCQSGTRLCYAGAETTSVCDGYVLPSVEICDGIDNDCDGLVDMLPGGCSVCGRSEETCDGVDNDCDGQTDEGLRNACGQCLSAISPEELGGPGLCNGADDDCDGSVDEGLRNACGLCNASCYTDSYSTDGQFSTGELDGTAVDGGVKLSSNTTTFADLWVANSAADTVTRIDTATNTVVGTWNVGIHAGVGNDSPSRTAIDFDGNAWIANRAHGLVGSVTKIRGGDCRTDCVLFNVPIGGANGLPRALAIDSEGYPWVGVFNESRIYRLNPANGAVLEQYNIGVTPYGIAIDNRGILWSATLSNQGIGAFDLNTRTVIGNWQVPGCSQTYGIAVDGAGNVWAGNWGCNGIVRLDRASFDRGDRPPSMARYLNDNIIGTRGVAVDAAGAVWVAASNSNRIGRFQPGANTWITYPSCDLPTGVGVANDGAIWSACFNRGGAYRHRASDGVVTNDLATGAGVYSYSDLTGFQLRNFTAPRGNWRQIFDCGFTNCQFDGASWTVTLPGGTTMTARFRTSPDASAWSPWTAEFSSSPARFTLPRGRYLQIDVLMTTPTNGITPTLTGFNIDWQRP